MIIENINSPSDLKKLGLEEMKVLADEMRQMIIQTVSANGGHLSSNLGVVELTIAIHYVFDSPKDKIIWDVGHQSYSHKIITGRRQKFFTIRKEDGLSGFPRTKESVHDVFGTGHSSTSISAALGIIEARDKNGDDFKVIAVIGDGAMSGGLAFEGLNNAGHLKNDLIVILNDNEMSISPNVGALSAYMNRILTGEFYRKFKKETKAFLEGIPKVGVPFTKIAQKAEETIKGILLPGIIFEELGFDYVGPIDGHNIELIIETLKRIKSSTSPTLIHVITKKGKGYIPSENHPSIFHGVGPFECETGSIISHKEHKTYSEVFGNKLVELAERDKRIVAITAAMKEGTGLDLFSAKFPERFYDVGIAEQHAVTFAAGLAAGGLRPFVAIYSTFLQRAYDQIIHDVCLQNLPVVIAIDRAGIVGEDGPTHQGLFDISFLRHIPNLTFMAPKDGKELEDMLEFSLMLDCPIAIRYPRGTVPNLGYNTAEITYGRGEILKTGSDLAILAVGNCVIPAIRASERLMSDGFSVTVINARFIKPLDKELIVKTALNIPKIITIEENVLQGGFGSAVLECLHDAEISSARIKCIGIKDTFVEQGKPDNLRAKYGLDAESIYQIAISLIRETISV